MSMDKNKQEKKTSETLWSVAGCPMVQFVNLVAGKWAIPILYRLILANAPVRFADLKRQVAPITQKELTRQLRAFEAKGLVERRIFAEVPPRVEYRITSLGMGLRSPLNQIASWMKINGARLAD